MKARFLPAAILRDARLWRARHSLRLNVGITNSVVIARLDRAIQYSETSVIEPRGRGLLDSPLSRGMTAVMWHHSISLMLRRPRHAAVSKHEG